VALTGVFGDAVYLTITVAFFGLAWLLVKACERIAGDDEILVEPSTEDREHRERDEDRALSGKSSGELVGGRA
jgi:hypothetical protein